MATCFIPRPSWAVIGGHSEATNKLLITTQAGCGKMENRYNDRATGSGSESVVSDPSVDQTGQGLYSLKRYDVYVLISLVNRVPDLYFYIAYC